MTLYSIHMDSPATGHGKRSSVSARPRARICDIVGCGAVTKAYHAPLLRRLQRKGRIRVRFCIDAQKEAAARLAAMFPHSVPLSAHEATGEVIRKAEVALIATPPESHAEWVLRYLSNNAVVLVEKPAVTSEAEFEAVVQAASGFAGRVLVGHFRRFYPSLVAAREAIMGGAIGELRRVEVYEGFRWDWPSRSRYMVESPVGGVILDTGSHAVDMALYAAGLDDEPDVNVAVDSLSKSPSVEPSHEIRASLVLLARGECLELYVMLSRRTPLANVVRLIGSQGEIFIPTTYSKEAVMKVGCDTRGVGSLGQDRVAVSIEDAFANEYRELLNVAQDRDLASRLDIRQFGVLARVLEVLTTAGA